MGVSTRSSVIIIVVVASFLTFLTSSSQINTSVIYETLSPSSTEVAVTVQSTSSNPFSHYEERYGYIRPSPRESRHPNCTRTPEWQFFALGENERSRLNEDRIIYEWFFQNRTEEKGTYLELGAFNGQKESNTRFFDECLGWDGMLVEPNPRMKEQLIQSRPRAHKLFFAPSCQFSNDTMSFIASDFTDARQTRSGENVTSNKRHTKVACGPFSPVLETLMDGHVNFVSLDVEGAEAMIIKTIDWTKVRFDVMIVESFNQFCQKECEHRREVRELMIQAGYLLFVDGVPRSDTFVHPSIVERPPPRYSKVYTNLDDMQGLSELFKWKVSPSGAKEKQERHGRTATI